MPRALLLVLQPLFRYSDSRGAWILRGVGERYGPVLRPAGDQASAERASEPPSARERLGELPSRIRVRLPAALVLSGLVIAAALGFMVARTGGSHPSPARLGRHASAGLLEVSFPFGWRRQAPPSAPQLGLTDELALAPVGDGGEMLLIGKTTSVGPDLLPQSLLATLPSAPTAQIVTLGATKFYRYLNLSPRGQSTSESVYALPSTAGTILGACFTQGVRPAFTSSCERLLGTLKLTSATVLAPGPSPTYAAALNTVMTKLNATRSKAGLQLLSARDAQSQAQAATELAPAHAEPATALLRLTAGPASAANSAVAAALSMTGNAFAALGRAAGQNDPGGYSAASAALARATKVLNAAYAQLSTSGYRVS